MHKNTQKFAKLPVTTCGYSMVKFARLDHAFSEFCELQQKDKERRKKKGAKKETVKPQDVHVGHFLVQNFDFFECPSKNVVKHGASGKAFCHVANAFLSRLELVWPISRLKISKMSKKMHFWQKALLKTNPPKSLPNKY